MLCLEHISWNSPDGKQLLKGLDLEIPDGKLVVVTGPNGGGKTTLAKIIAGIETPLSGKIILDGEDISDKNVTERARMGLSFAFQQPVRFKGITVRRLIEVAAGRELKDLELCEILGKVGLCAKEYIDREVNATLSGGEIKRIEIATVIARDSKIAIFDEPEAGIDLWSFKNLIEVFRQMHEEKKNTLIIISHQERILRIADEIVLVANGKIQDRGPREEMLKSMRFKAMEQEAAACGRGEAVFSE